MMNYILFASVFFLVSCGNSVATHHSNVHDTFYSYEEKEGRARLQVLSENGAEKSLILILDSRPVSPVFTYSFERNSFAINGKWFDYENENVFVFGADMKLVKSFRASPPFDSVEKDLSVEFGLVAPNLATKPGQ